ncbi:flagellar basal body rod protein FlgC [Afifella marina]|uniref:Flagellar basal-body rod protein FlgC n=1 Tax=Afifella marina DSM 2698 TaxID=1120955 RepID=A0A1G5MUR6_AFIMA|nr:flagellar basal body rod protein FlgC [Afifella marina]MBK1622035.1 flagellar basal body rod protein FlgC [Afifella marina DSM 2698]MBK1627828.1 flagellar basal body rod protein FlgC [Afifella marina]MBK5916795.1 flagellar basal body rod protein FlgC [Afifella marina]RAI19879.1 flagellar basal body rod protein FlgC [Afifella marina DSM 2698]SCZ28935.1 flagellar basal-body rod protein FlgC [Afifella marina DSM 2698]
MIDPLASASQIAASGLRAQSTRLRIVAENLANAQSTGTTPGADPYVRKTVSFESVLDRTIDAASVKVKALGVDNAPFRLEHDPSHPAADENGNVKMPNVNPIIEMADLRETTRSYEANLQVIKRVRNMFSTTIDLLRNS